MTDRAAIEVDTTDHPERYRVGRGEEGVFRYQPYKSELLPLWRFATPDLARDSAAAILERFRAYVDAGDAVGADLARKYLQMGFTRSRRYARHAGGRKYAPRAESTPGQSREELPVTAEDPVKAESARIFKAAWDEAAADERYRELVSRHRERWG